jgi:sugar lactone lactonase YvrE
MTSAFLKGCIAATFSAGVAAAGTAQEVRAQAQDSAAVARAAYRSAAAALGTQDLSTAKEQLRRALAAWPTQDAYAFALARVAAAQGDTATSFGALDHSASLGIARDIASDSSFAKLRGSSTFAGLVARFDRNRAPIASSRVHVRLHDDSLFIESLVYDASRGRYFGTDVQRRRVITIDSAGDTETFVDVPRELGAPLGIALDPVAHVLWVGTAVPAFPDERAVDSTRGAALIRVDIGSRAITTTLRLPRSPGGHVVGDVICSRRGDVYATDSSQPVIYRVARDADTLETWLTHSLFRSLQGLAFSADETALFVADYSHGLMRIDMRSHEVIRIADAAHSTTLGIDGLRMHRGELIAIQNGIPIPRVVRIALDPSGTMVRRFDVVDQNLPEADEPTNGVLVGDTFVYPSHVPWNEHDDAGGVRAGVRLRAPTLLSLPLPLR